MTHGVLFVAVLFVLAPASRAEKWVDTGHAVLIDVDSIKKDKDGLVYYFEKRRSYDMDNDGNPAGTSWGKKSKAAMDCDARLSFSSYAIEYEADWRAKGATVIKGTMGEVLFDFVCSRVKE